MNHWVDELNIYKLLVDMLVLFKGLLTEVDLQRLNTDGTNHEHHDTVT